MTHRNKKGKFQAIRKEIRKNSAAEKHEKTIDQKTPQKEDIKDPGGEQNQSKKRNIEKDKIQNGYGHKKKGTEVAKTIDSAENIPRKTKKIDNISQALKKSDTDGQQAKNHNIFTTTSPRGKLIADVLLQRLPNGAIELPAKLCSVIGDVDKMKPFFVRDPKTGKSLVDPNARRIQDGSTVLQLAIKSRNSAAVKLLLDNGADCSLADYMGDNAVMLAIKEGEAAVINQLWPQRGALDVNHANIFGITALHLAADRKWEGCVNFLLQNGANPNATSTSGITPLMFAACKGALKIVDLLLKAGADVLRVDNEFDTCVSRVPLEANREVVEHVLGHIGDVQKEQFLGLTMDLMQRKPPPTDINNVLVNKFLPLIEACTRLPSYREAFHRKNVVRFLNVNMRHEIQSLEAATIASHIVFCVMFRFNKDAVDQGFVYQFLECKGPDTVFSLVTRLKVALKISHKETLMFFLPVIGLSEVPAGRIWLERNNLLVSEYLGYFERDSLKVYLAPLTCRHWCMEADRFPLVDRTWKRFYDIVNTFAAKQRQKNMLELLRDEELEKTRQAKRKEKEKKATRTEPNSQRNPINIDYETIFGYPLETDVEEKRSSQLDADYKIISDMFCGVSPPACSNDNAERNDAAQHNTNSNGVPSALKTSAPVVVSNVAKQDEWTTVQGKKMTKDKVDEKQTQRVESPTKQLRFPKKDTTPSKKPNKPKTQNARPVGVVFTQECKPLSTPVSGVHRWADVAKGLGKTKCEEVTKNTNDALPASTETNGTFLKHDFPSLDGSPEQTDDVPATRTKPTKMTFTFHEPNDICSVNLMTQPAASPLSLGDMIEQELSECASAVELPLTASTSVDSASPICNRKIQAAVTQEDRYSGGDEVMSVECFMYDPEYIETPDSELAQESTKLTDSPAVRCHGGSPNQTMGTKWLEELNVTDEDLSSDDDASVILDELAHAVTREIEEDSENEIIKIMEKNQRESFYQFEKVALEERESAAFISLPPSPENVLPARNAIDALFETPGYIPQSFESDEEDGKSSSFSISTSSTPDLDRNILSTSIGPSPENIQVVQSKSKLGSDTLDSLKNTHNSTITCPASRPGDKKPGPISRPRAPDDGLSGNITCQLQKDTHINSPPKSAFKTPLKTIGQQILHNVQRMDKATSLQIPDEVGDPSDLGGVPVTEDDVQRKEDIPKSSEHFFPSFHETPKQTANIIDSGYTLFQEFQMHREKLIEFYENNKRDILENKNNKRNQFIFYAQHIGLTHEEIKQYLIDCLSETQSQTGNVPRQSDPRPSHDCPLPFSRQQSTNGIPTQNKHHGNQFPQVHQPIHFAFGNQTTFRPTIVFTPAPTQNARPQNNATPENTGNNCNNEDQLRNNRLQPIYRPTGMIRAQLQSKQPGLVNSMGQRANLEGEPKADGSQTMPSNQLPVFHEKRAGPVSQAGSFQQWSVDESPFTKSNMPTNSNGMSDGKGQINHQCQETGHGYPSNWKNMPKEQLQPNDRIERPVAPVGSYSAMLQAQRNRKDYSNAQPPRSGDPFSTGQQPNSYHTQDVTPKHIMQKDPNHGQVPAATRFPDVYMQPPRPFPNNKLPSLQTNGALIETCQALYAAKIISVRWRDELERLRGLPAHMCMFVNNIVIPAADKDRVYISYHSTGPSILGHLRDGTEVSVRLMHPSAARVSPDLANKLLNMDESEHFILKYKDFVYSDGLLYVASELHEYTLTEFLVRERNTDDTYRQRMLFQLLRGIKRLHQDHLCVHGELRPDNVLFDVNWTVKLAGYGLGRNREGPTVDYSEDDMCWLPPEVLVHKKQVNFKSDIFATGMLIYYILRNCRNPFGSSPAEILRNIEASSPQVEAVSDEAADLLATMLSINKIERPSINNTLDHPCFWGEEKKFRFINIVGSDVVYELKHGLDKRESMIDILCNVKNTTKFCKWMEVIEPHLLRDMTVYRQYKNTLLDLVLFVHNYCAHTDKLSERSQRAVDEPCSYFLSRFPSLFMAVYRAIKRSGKRHKTCYAPFF